MIVDGDDPIFDLKIAEADGANGVRQSFTCGEKRKGNFGESVIRIREFDVRGEAIPRNPKGFRNP